MSSYNFYEYPEDPDYPEDSDSRGEVRYKYCKKSGLVWEKDNGTWMLVHWKTGEVHKGKSKATAIELDLSKAI